MSNWRGHVLAVPARGASARTLWSADHDGGDLTEWYAPSTEVDGNELGGEFNNDGATTAASTDVFRSGTHAAKLTVPETPVAGGSGARLFRWGESQTHRTAYYEAWYRFPNAYTLTDIPDDGFTFWNLMQFKSRNQGATLNDPFWIVEGVNPSPGVIRMRLVWWGNMNPAEGPHAGESGFRAYTQSAVNLPLNQWVRFRVRFKQSRAGIFDGAITVWQDDRRLFDLTQIRTGYDNTNFNAWGTETSWAVTNYSNGLVPGPSPVYVDDPRIFVSD